MTEIESGKLRMAEIFGDLQRESFEKRERHCEKISNDFHFLALWLRKTLTVCCHLLELKLVPWLSKDGCKHAQNAKRHDAKHALKMLFLFW